MVNGQVHSSTGNGDMLRKIGAGAWGNTRAIGRDIGNSIAFIEYGIAQPIGEITGLWDWDHPSMALPLYDADSDRRAGQQQVYPGISSDNLLVGSGGVLADTVMLFAGPEAIVKGISLGARAPGWSVKLAPRLNPLNYRPVMGELYSGVPRLTFKAPNKIEQLYAAKTGAPVKNLTEQAADLVPLNGGRNRVTLRSPSQQMEVDLAGKSHGGVPTPHTKVSPLNPRAPNQPAFNTKNSPVEPATQQDIRTVRRYLERQN